MLTVDSPNSESSNQVASPKKSSHTTPTEKAFEAREERRKALLAQRPQAPKPRLKEQPVEEELCESTEAVAEEAVAVKTEEVANEVACEPKEAESKAEEGKRDEPIVYPTHPTSAQMSSPATAPDPVPEMPKKKKRFFHLSLLDRKALSGWLFVLPFVIGIIFVYAPIVWDSIAMSFSTVRFTQQGVQLTWNNFANYSAQFNEIDWFATTIIDAFKDLILQIPAIVIFALFMAIILNQKMTGRAVFRAIFFLPVILSTGIIDTLDSSSKFFEALEGAQGGVDDNTGSEEGGIISALDIESLLGGIKIGTELVNYVVDLVNNIFDIVSRSGVQMLIFLSGLQSISPAIYESCEVEGASAWETFWKITLPMISPMILVNAIYTVIDAFTTADNRVMKAVMEEFSRRHDYGLANSMIWSYVGVVLVVIVVVALVMKTVVFYQRRD